MIGGTGRPSAGARRWGVALGVVVACLAVGAAPSAAGKRSGSGPGNSPNAKACQKGGWKTLVRSDGTRFTSERACTSYAAKGGTLFRLSEAPCLDGGYREHVTSTGESFSSQSACVTYVRGGGTLEPKPNPREQYQTTCTGSGGSFDLHGTAPEDWHCHWSWTLGYDPEPDAGARATLDQICTDAGGDYGEVRFDLPEFSAGQLKGYCAT